MVGRALQRKLLRDVWATRSQALAIGLVLAAGVTMYVAYLSNFATLRRTQAEYYERYRFADVFARAMRAPARLQAALEDIPGVARADTRVVVDVPLDVAGLAEPATGRLISIAVPRRPMLNDLYLLRGRWVARGRPGEAMVSESFATAHGLTIGSAIAAVINGRRRDLTIVGIAASPEYVYGIRPGELIPDPMRFGVFWIERRELAAAFNLEGAFNDAALMLAPDASVPEVIARVDDLLRAYGGVGAIPRALQLSHWTLDNELRQLQTMGLIIPVVFLLVAAFLLNVVLTRMVAVQRGQIAALKALGYANREVAWHYIQWSLIITLFGAIVGVAGGAWMGTTIVALYNQYFAFPSLQYWLPAPTVLTALAIALTAGLLGAVGGVLRAVRLPPAEAMRPPVPARFRRSWVERAGLFALLAPVSRMIVRNMTRHPVRATMSVVGIGLAAAMMVLGMFSLDAIDTLVDVQFHQAQRQDISVQFVEPSSSAALYEVARLPGVLAVEPVRSVAVRLRAGHRSRQVAIVGLERAPRLNRIITAEGRAVSLPPDGLVISATLAAILGVAPGDQVEAEILDRARRAVTIGVARVIDDYMGTAAYMHLDALRALLHEGDTVTGAFLEVDARAVPALYARAKQTPRIAGTASARAMLDSFNRTLEENMHIMIFFNVLFSSVIAIGVVYNAARISLSERSRELASLRVLGLTRAEISAILLGELALLTAMAIPVGLLAGYAFAALLVSALNTELYRFPLVVAPRTFAWAAVTVITAAALSALVVRRRLDRLDLVGVLKAAE